MTVLGLDSCWERGREEKEALVHGGRVGEADGWGVELAFELEEVTMV